MSESYTETQQERIDRIEAEEERERGQQARFRAIAAVYEKADRILTGEQVTVQLTKVDNGISAWNDGRIITLNTTILRNYEDSDIVSLHGVNYHEFAHIRYTPRAGSELMRWVVENQYNNAFNVLEDQRIETLLAARYPSTKPFLTAAILRYVLFNSTSRNPLNREQKNNRIFRSYPLIHGRKFLKASLRAEVAAAFVKERSQEEADSIAQIIDEYRTLVYPSDSKRAKVLIARFALILQNLGFDRNTGACGDRAPLKSGRPEGAKTQQVDAKKATRTQEDEQAEDEVEDSAGQDSPQDSGDEAEQPMLDEEGQEQPDLGEGDEEEEEEEEEEGDEFGEGDEDSGDEQDADEEGGSPTPSRGFGESDEDLEYKFEQEEVNQSLVDAINEILKTIERSSAVQREVREFRRAVRTHENAHSRFLQSKHELHPALAENIKTARMFGNELRVLEEEAAAAWERSKPTGRLNINRAMNADINDIDKMFDRWYEGSDAVEIEAAILLDRSGSMGYRIDSACQALWTIKRGLEQVGSRVTAYTFAEHSKLLYAADEEAAANAYRYVWASGNTNPLKALEDTEYIMSTSSRATKLVFIITDGVWHSTASSNDVIKRMKASGVFVVLIYIGSLDPGLYGWSTDGIRHGADILRVIGHPKDLVATAKAITTKYLRDRIGRK